jgi:hypothetical protein
MKKYVVTFHMINKEIDTLIEESSLLRAKNRIQNHFEDTNSPVLSLADDLVIVKSNVQYFTVAERD